MGRNLYPITWALLLGVSLGGCWWGGEKKEALTLHLSHGEEIRTLDPAVAYDALSWQIIPQIYETLFQYSYLSDPYQVEPLLAADLPQISEDGKTVTIPIRRGIYFQNSKIFPEGKGRELTAKDFLFSFKRLLDPRLKSPGFWIFDGKVVGWSEFKKQLETADPKKIDQLLSQDIKGIRALDRYTLRFHLYRPYPQLLAVLSMPFTSAVPKELSEIRHHEKRAIDDQAVGTGPFRLEEWKKGERFLLTANEKYHPDFYPIKGHRRFREEGLLRDAGKPLPYVEKIEFRIIRNERDRWSEFLKGNLDMVPLPPDEILSVLNKDGSLAEDLVGKGMHLDVVEGLTIHYLSINMNDPILGKNADLRKALSSIVNRQRLIQRFFYGRAKEMVHALPPGIQGRGETSQGPWPYQEEEAQKLLKKAGFPKGKGLPNLHLDMRGDDTFSRKMGKFLQEEFQHAGVNLTVLYNSFPTYLEKLKSGKTQLVYASWAMDYPDPENIYQLLYGPHRPPGPNDSHFNERTFNHLFEEMSLMEPGNDRNELIAQMEKILKNESPWIYLFYGVDQYLLQPWLQDVRPSRQISNRFKYFRIRREIKNRYRH